MSELLSELSSQLDIGSVEDPGYMLGYHCIDIDSDVKEDDVSDEDPAYPGMGVPKAYRTNYSKEYILQKNFCEEAITGEFKVDECKVQVLCKSPLSGKLFKVTEMKEVYDDPTDVSNPYWTLSGDNPVIYSEAEQASQMVSAGKWNCIDPEYIPTYYSAGISWKLQERNFHIVVKTIWKYRDNPAKLREIWNRFWKRTYSYKTSSDRAKYWLFGKHIKSIVNTFKKFGITKKSK